MKGIYLYIILVLTVLGRNYTADFTNYLSVSDNFFSEIFEVEGMCDCNSIDMDVDNDNDKFKYLGLLHSYNYMNIAEHLVSISLSYLSFLVYVDLLNHYIDLPPPFFFDN